MAPASSNRRFRPSTVITPKPITVVPGSIPRMIRSATGLLLATCPSWVVPMSVGRTLLMVFRWGIFLLACVFLYVRLFGPKGILANTGSMPSMGSELPWTTIILCIGLMFVNWAVEAVKWRLLVVRVERLSFLRAFSATIAGTSVGLVTVNRTGEFIGRVLFLAPEDRVSGSFASSLGSIAQFVVTLVFGGCGLVVLTLMDVPLPWPSGWISGMLATLTGLVTCTALILFLEPGLFRQLLLLVPFLRRFEAASNILSRYERSDLVTVLLLSGARYLIFGLQYVLLLKAFGAGIDAFTSMAAITVIYLIATLIPSIMLTELGVRGSVAIAVLEPLGVMGAIALIATSCLWMINVAAPACAGSLILLFAHIRTKRDPA